MLAYGLCKTNPSKATPTPETAGRRPKRPKYTSVRKWLRQCGVLQRKNWRFGLRRGDFTQMRNDIQAKLFSKRVFYPRIGTGFLSLLFLLSQLFLNSSSTLLFYVCSTTLYGKPLLLDSDIYLGLLPFATNQPLQHTAFATFDQPCDTSALRL